MKLASLSSRMNKENYSDPTSRPAHISSSRMSDRQNRLIALRIKLSNARSETERVAIRRQIARL